MGFVGVVVVDTGAPSKAMESLNPIGSRIVGATRKVVSFGDGALRDALPAGCTRRAGAGWRRGAVALRARGRLDGALPAAARCLLLAGRPSHRGRAVVRGRGRGRAVAVARGRGGDGRAPPRRRGVDPGRDVVPVP